MLRLTIYTMATEDRRSTKLNYEKWALVETIRDYDGKLRELKEQLGECIVQLGNREFQMASVKDFIEKLETIDLHKQMLINYLSQTNSRKLMLHWEE